MDSREHIEVHGVRQVSVIIPAAGSGRRFGRAVNKIFQPLAGRAVFLRTLDIFAARDDVCQILLVLSAGDRQELADQFASELEAMNVTPVTGGAVRAESVRNALALVDERAGLICVHDAVRPCVRQDQIDTVFAAAGETGAAILASPLHGTLKLARDGKKHIIERTVPREGLWEAQTPQVFAADLLRAAYEGDVAGVTDDSQLIEAAGHAVRIVPCPPTNIKVTTPADLALAEAILAGR